MLYIINGVIKFRSEDGVVLLEGNEEPVVILSATMSRLLVFFLDSQGEVCSRTDILQKIWDAHGLRSSNNSLNKYVTDLRKLFSKLGINENVITTVPRIGFVFSTDIDIEREGVADDVVNRSGENVKKTECKKYNAFIYSIGLVILLLTPVLFSNHLLNLEVFRGNTVSDKQSFPLGVIENCNVRILNKTSKEMIPVNVRVAANLIQKSRIICGKDSTVYMQIADPVVYGYIGRVFISMCDKASQDKYNFSSCKSYYELDYAIQK